MNWMSAFLDPTYVPSDPRCKKVTREIFDNLIQHAFKQLCCLLPYEPKEVRESLALEAVEIFFFNYLHIRKIVEKKDTAETEKIIFAYFNTIVRRLRARHLRNKEDEKKEVFREEGQLAGTDGGSLVLSGFASESPRFEEAKLDFSLAFVHFVLNSCLSEKDQSIIARRFGRHPKPPYKVIAVEHSTTEAVVRQAYSRALRRLREAIVQEAKRWLDKKEWRKYKNGDPLVLQHLIDELEEVGS